MTTPNPPLTAQALLALGDEDFVRQAYLLVLGREADPGGRDNYLGAVRGGADKAQLVAQLALSDEGQQRHVSVPGLDTLLQAQPPIGPPPLLQRVMRRLLAPLRGPSPEPLERALRAIDNRLYRMEQTLAQQHTSMAALAEQVAQLQASPVQGLQALHAAAPGVASLGAKTPVPRQAPPRVEQLYRSLQRMLVRRTGHVDA